MPKLGVYLSFYLIHLVYYGTIGPLWAMLMPIKLFRYILMNLLFIRVNPWCFFQNIYWISCVIPLVFLFFSYTTLEESMIYSTWMNIFFRSATISGKYSTYPIEEIERIFWTLIAPSTVRGEMMLDSWNRQVPEVVQKELWSLSRREKLQAVAVELATTHEPPALSEEQTKMASKGLGAARMLNTDDIILKLTQIQAELGGKQSIASLLVLIYAFVRGFACGLCNLIVGLRFHGNTLEEAILFYPICLFQSTYFSVGPMFFLLAFKDFKRRLYLLRVGLAVLSKRPVPECPELSELKLATSQDSNALLGLIYKLSKFGDRFLQRHRALVAFMAVHWLLLSLALIPKIIYLFDYTRVSTSEQKLFILLIADYLVISIPLLFILGLITRMNSVARELKSQLQSSKFEDVNTPYNKDKGSEALNNGQLQSQILQEAEINIGGVSVGWLLIIALVLVTGAILGLSFWRLFAGRIKII